MRITRRRAELTLVCALCAGVATGQDLALPQGAELTFAFSRDPGAYDLPTGPWTPEAGLPVRRIEGAVTLQSWRIDGSGLTPLQILRPLRAQLEQSGFAMLFDCLDQACGGFDFRFATTVLPAPHMYVDLTDYQFLAMQNEAGQAVSLLASGDSNAGYLQIIRAGDLAGDNTPSAPRLRGAPEGDIARRLERDGHVVLSDVVFETGSTTLGDGTIASLDAIAAYLLDNPARRVLFVGHTDATGSLEANQAVSLRRAQAAVGYLRQRYDLDPGQVTAQGAGYLAPIATNLTEEGRDANRRVEAVLLPME